MFVWKNLPYGIFEGHQTFPDGHSPKGKSDDPREIPWAKSQENHQGITTALDFWIKTVKIMKTRVALGLTLNIFP